MNTQDKEWLEEANKLLHEVGPIWDTSALRTHLTRAIAQPVGLTDANPSCTYCDGTGERELSSPDLSVKRVRCHCFAGQIKSAVLKEREACADLALAMMKESQPIAGEGLEPVATVTAQGDTIILHKRLPIGTKLYASQPSPAAGALTDRATFEAAMQGKDFHTTRFIQGCYVRVEMQTAWIGWQAALAAQPPASPQVAVPEFFRQILDHPDPSHAQYVHGFKAGHKAAQVAVPVQASGKSLNAKVADLLRPFLKPGQKVIWREPFRWHDDDGVLSNHYDGMEVPSLAADFGYNWEYDFTFLHAAIITPKDAATQPQGEKSNG